MECGSLCAPYSSAQTSHEHPWASVSIFSSPFSVYHCIFWSMLERVQPLLAGAGREEGRRGAVGEGEREKN